MKNAAMKLDTLAYSKKLISTGCDQKLAEAHASAQQNALVEISEDYLSQFATKQDVAMLKQDMDAKFALFEQKIVFRLGAPMMTLFFITIAILKFHW